MNVIITKPSVSPISPDIGDQYVELINRAFKSNTGGDLVLEEGWARIETSQELVDNIDKGSLYTVYTTSEDKASFLSSLRSKTPKAPTTHLEVTDLLNIPESATILAATGLVPAPEEEVRLFNQDSDPLDHYMLRYLVVDPDAWGTGIGSKLLGVVEEHLSSSISEPAVIIFETVVDVGNDIFYKKRGYRIVSQYLAPVGQWGIAQTFTVVRMEKTVHPRIS